MVSGPCPSARMMRSRWSGATSRDSRYLQGYHPIKSPFIIYLKVTGHSKNDASFMTPFKDCNQSYFHSSRRLGVISNLPGVDKVAIYFLPRTPLDFFPTARLYSGVTLYTPVINQSPINRLNRAHFDSGVDRGLKKQFF